jgi:hypothetical protein
MKSKLISAAMCGFLILFILPVPGLAGLGVSGALFMENVSPGQSVAHEIVVNSDLTDPPMDFIVEVAGFGQALDGGNIRLQEEVDNSPYSARSFLNISPKSFHLDSGASQKVVLDGIIPKDVGNGGRYALASIHSQPMGNGTVGISVGADVLVALTIVGTEQQISGEITGLELIKPVESEHTNVSLIYKNTGNYHYKSRVEAVLSNDKGEFIINASTPLSFSSILPTMSREFKMSLNPGKKLSQGKYRINASVNLEDGTVLATKEIAFRI